MSTAATAWLDAMIAVSWEFSLLAGLAWLLEVSLLRKAPVALRHALWGLVLLRLLVPVSFESPIAQAPAAPSWTQLETDWPVVPAELPADSLERLSVPDGPSAPALPTPGGGLSEAGSGRLHWPLAVASVWIVVLLLLTYRLHRKRRWARRDLELPADRIAQLTTRASDLVGLRRPPTLRVAPALAEGPLIEGALRPRVLLPKELCSWPEPRLLAVLVHELVHLKRRDPVVRGLANLIQLVYWFHPMVWLAGSRLRALREQAVDDHVAELLGTERFAYLHALLDFVTKRATPLLEPALGMASRRSPLAARIHRMMRRDYRPTSPTWRSLMTLSAGTLVLALLAGSSPTLTAAPNEILPRIRMLRLYDKVYLTSTLDELDTAETLPVNGDVAPGWFVVSPRASLDALQAEHPEIVAPLRDRPATLRVLVDPEGRVRSVSVETEGVANEVRELLEANARSIQFQPTVHKDLGPVPAEMILRYQVQDEEPRRGLLDPDEELLGFEVLDVAHLSLPPAGEKRAVASMKPPFLRILGTGEPPDLGGASLAHDLTFVVEIEADGTVMKASLVDLYQRPELAAPDELQEALEQWVPTFELEPWPEPELPANGFVGVVDLRVRDGSVAIASRSTVRRETLAARFVEDYALPAGRVLEIRNPRHDELRQEYYRYQNPLQARAIPRGPSQMVIGWAGSVLDQPTMCFGCNRLEPLLEALGFSNHRAEPELLRIPVPVDVIYRRDTEPALLIDALEAELAEKLDLHLDLELVTEPARSLVFRGTWEGIERDPENENRPTLHVFHREKDSDPRVLSGGILRDPPAITALIGQHLGMPALDETIGTPEEPIAIRLHRSAVGTRFVNEVIASLEEQSNLEVSIEERPMELVRISNRVE